MSTIHQCALQTMNNKLSFILFFVFVICITAANASISDYFTQKPKASTSEVSLRSLEDMRHLIDPAHAEIFADYTRRIEESKKATADLEILDGDCYRTVVTDIGNTCDNNVDVTDAQKTQLATELTWCHVQEADWQLPENCLPRPTTLSKWKNCRKNMQHVGGAATAYNNYRILLTNRCIGALHAAIRNLTLEQQLLRQTGKDIVTDIKNFTSIFLRQYKETKIFLTEMREQQASIKLKMDDFSERQKTFTERQELLIESTAEIRNNTQEVLHTMNDLNKTVYEVSDGVREANNELGTLHVTLGNISEKVETTVSQLAVFENTLNVISSQLQACLVWLETPINVLIPVLHICQDNLDKFIQSSQNLFLAFFFLFGGFVSWLLYLQTRTKLVFFVGWFLLPYIVPWVKIFDLQVALYLLAFCGIIQYCLNITVISQHPPLDPIVVFNEFHSHRLVELLVQPQ